MLFIQFASSLMYTSNMLYVNNQVWVALLILLYKQEACTESFKTSDIAVISIGIYCSMYFLLSCTEMLVIIHVFLYLISVIFLVFSLLKNKIFNFDSKKKGPAVWFRITLCKTFIFAFFSLFFWYFLLGFDDFSSNLIFFLR